MEKIKENKNNWIPKYRRFVAFLDILGFKELVMRNSHDDIYNKLKAISKSIEEVEKIQKKESELLNNAEVRIVSFSDSIVIFSKSDDLDNFNYFLVITSYIFSEAIDNRIPIKGGMAYGEITLNQSKNIYFGQPIIDAYSMEEDVNYMGVVAHSSIDNFISNLSEDEIKESRENKFFFEMKTPLKCGNLNHLNLKWFVDSKNQVDIPYVKTTINNFKNSTSGSARKYIDNTMDVLEKLEQLEAK